jgi:hypothetical protein
MRPSVGRVVHYTSYGTPGGEYTSECRAAIVTEVIDDHLFAARGVNPPLSLCVLSPNGMFFDRNVDPGPAGDGGTWHWPERVDDGKA